MAPRSGGNCHIPANFLGWEHEFSWVGAGYYPHPGPLPEGEGENKFPLPEGKEANKFPLPEGEGANKFPLPLGEGQRVREGKSGGNCHILATFLGRGHEFSWVGACPHPGPLPEGEGANKFPLPLGEGQRVREGKDGEKNEKNAQIGRFYTTFTQPLSLSFTVSSLFPALFLAILFLRGRVRRAISFTSNQNAVAGTYTSDGDCRW